MLEHFITYLSNLDNLEDLVQLLLPLKVPTPHHFGQVSTMTPEREEDSVEKWYTSDYNLIDPKTKTLIGRVDVGVGGCIGGPP